MKNGFFTKAEVLESAGIVETDISEWLKWKLLKPAGFTEGREPLFSEDALTRVSHIRRLTELGYGLEEIQKIIKKVGLPRKKSEKKAADNNRFLTVGDLAERSGVSPRTIKHWEDKGIIEPDMRSEGGFRLYSEAYVFLSKLIRDLQLFGYTLEDIKGISDHFRSFLAIQADLHAFPKAEVEAKLDSMLQEIKTLLERMKLLEEGIERWKGLLKKKKKDILSLKNKNEKRSETIKGDLNA